MAGAGPGLAASRMGDANKQVRDAQPLQPSGVTPLHRCSHCGLLAPWVFVHAPLHTAHFRWCLHRVIGTTDNLLHGGRGDCQAYGGIS